MTASPGRRLLILVVGTSLLVALAYRRPVTYRVDVGGADDASYLRGFNERESAGRLTWRWSKARSEVVFHNAGQIVPHALLRVRCAARHPDVAAFPEVRLALGGAPLAEFTAPRLAVRSFEVDAARAGPGDWVLGMSVERLYEAGNRALGVQVDWAELAPESIGLVPPLRTLLCAVLACALLFGLLRPPLGERAAFLLSGGAAVLSAGGLAFAREEAVAILQALAPALLLAAGAALAGRALPGLLARLGPARHPGSALAALALALGGEALVGLDVERTVGVAVLLAGAILLWCLPQRWAGPAEPGPPEAPIGTPEALAVLLVAGLALFMRLYRLEAVPFAIFRDEARHGFVALRILNDPAFHPLFLGPPINQPIPYFIALAGAFRIFGANLFGLRVVSAVAGALAPPLLWLLAREVFGRRVALLAAFGLAVSSWHVTISRFAVNYVWPTMLSLPAYWLLWRGLRKARALEVVLGSLLIGLAQYASHTAKGLFLVAGALLADEIVTRARSRDGAGLRKLAAATLAAGAVGLVALTPLLIDLTSDSRAYLARPAQVALWSDENHEGEYVAASLLDSAVRYAGAFNVEGDANGRHHLPGAPFLDPVSGVCFLLGAFSLLATLGARESRFAVVWLLAGLMPGLLTVDGPHALRTVEAAPAVYVVSALGAAGLWTLLGAFLRASPWRSGLVAAIGLGSVLAYNGWVYFVRMYESPAVWRRLAPLSTGLAHVCNRLGQDGALAAGAPVYAPETLLEDPDTVYVFGFLTRERFSLRPYEDVRTDEPGVLALPNYQDYWRLVAAGEPRYAPTVKEAGLEEARWRAELAPLLSGPGIAGPSFPATDHPMFWLFKVPAPSPAAPIRSSPEER